MKEIKRLLADAPQPINLSYAWNMGSLLGILIAVMIGTGIALAIGYDIGTGYGSMQQAYRERYGGWILQHIHSIAASILFLVLYLHIAKAMYVRAYNSRPNTWRAGVALLTILLLVAFLGYSIVDGAMSYWAITVITRILEWIPLEYILGDMSISNAVLIRLATLHYMLPLLAVGVIVLHIYAHHVEGSTSPIPVAGELVPMPAYLVKDTVTIAILGLIFAVSLLYPDYMRDAANYLPANSLETPLSIVPEWYTLPYYLILRAIPLKIVGVTLAVLSIGSILLLRELKIRIGYPLHTGWLFMCNFIFMIILGAKPIALPYTLLSIASTIIFFIALLTLYGY